MLAAQKESRIVIAAVLGKGETHDAQASANAVRLINPVEIRYVCCEGCTKLSVLFAVLQSIK